MQGSIEFKKGYVLVILINSNSNNDHRIDDGDSNNIMIMIRHILYYNTILHYTILYYNIHILYYLQSTIYYTNPIL